MRLTVRLTSAWFTELVLHDFCVYLAFVVIAETLPLIDILMTLEERD